MLPSPHNNSLSTAHYNTP